MTPIECTIVCTDRGQHGFTQLGDLTLERFEARDGSITTRLAPNIAFRYGSIAEKQTDWCVMVDDIDEENDDFRIRLRCPRCRRDVRWRGPRTVDLIERLHNAGLAQLDISLIP